MYEATTRKGVSGKAIQSEWTKRSSSQRKGTRWGGWRKEKGKEEEDAEFKRLEIYFSSGLVRDRISVRTENILVEKNE